MVQKIILGLLVILTALAGFFVWRQESDRGEARAERESKARTQASEKEALDALERLHTVLLTYQLKYGKYPQSLQQLGPADIPGARPSAEAADLVTLALSSGRLAGYFFDYRSRANRYEISAIPETGGARSFFVDQSGVIRWCRCPRAGPGDRPL